MSRHARPMDRHAPELWLADGTLVPAPPRLANAHDVGLSVEGIRALASGEHPRVDPR